MINENTLINECQDSITDKQVFQIKQQILAYKYMIRNIQLPRDLEKNISGLTKEQWDAEAERIMGRSLRYYNDKIDKSEELKKLVNDKIKKKNTEQITAQNELVLKIYKDQNKFQMEKRKKSIDEILEEQQILSDECKYQLMSEKLWINNFDFYKQMQETILLKKQNKLPCRILENKILDIQHYVKKKPQKKNESDILYKFDIQFRQKQEKRKQLKHREFIQQLFIHQSHFFEFHKKVKKQQKKRANNARNFLENLQIRIQQQKEKEARERVQVLKSKDMEGYIELIKNMKHTRILDLLKQTDNFLRELGAKIKEQKGDKQNEYDDEDLKFGQQSNNYAADLQKSNRVYYNLSHRIKENIDQQPELLEGGKLKSYQLLGLKWLISLYNNKLNGILADEMGLGKTIQTISLFAYLIEMKKNNGPFLVVVPLSTLSNWVLEFDKWAPKIKKIAYKGQPQVRKEIAKELKTTKWNVCITTYDYVLKDRLTLHKFDWKYIVVDEGHRMKNSRSKFTSILGQQYFSDYRLLLTGTPLQNNLAELWSLLNFLLPKVFSSCDDFEKWFSMPLAKFGSNEKESSLTEEEIFQLLIVYIKFQDLFYQEE
ncbi:RSC complex subunit, putative [Ichthyophthirius multifiliis]|uniref:RSC complex subunit, putative n=1 Tax=Ichthyophthirius multifiliis TaxID=5932 RepID=G0QLJ1_ICHMU|nr:RSC complex subunit, putative [Ichthyophthirius multifiliis]EGR33917.1 RSC complex subunit, putative [Ichthyophthirius multifiliis]|eukprot:XP_004039221.1 RSC complex subunit, putative [Ichthyophthirius multifiliis]